MHNPYLWSEIQLVKLNYQTGVYDKRQFIEALGRLYEQAK